MIDLSLVSLKNKQDATVILLHSLIYLMDNWTRLGYRLRSKNKSERDKVCVIGAVDLISKRLNLNADFAKQLLQDVAVSNFGMSAVSVNDELGHISVLKLVSLSLKETLTESFCGRY